jgi:hypothetical protein
MTAQMQDLFIYQRRHHTLSDIDNPNNWISIPEIVGYIPASLHTACWRGYIATYAISRGKLILKKLKVNRLNSDRVVTKSLQINKKSPENIESHTFNFLDIGYKIDFTGSLIITDDFIRELYVHMGFQSPFKYRKVIQLVFEKGKLIESIDLSYMVKTLRDECGIEIDGKLVTKTEFFDYIYHRRKT